MNTAQINKMTKKSEAKTYEIITCNAKPDWSRAAVAAIDAFVWGDAYTPQTEAQMVYVPQQGFVVRLRCFENHPRVTYDTYFSPVYRDSCMEVFAAFNQELPLYLNVEMNAAGTSLSELGTCRFDRQKVAGIDGNAPFPVQSERFPGGWQLTLTLPVQMICSLFSMHEEQFVPGLRFHGNFYKCGDDCEVPHFGMWNPVQVEHPDFHRPEWFGNFVMV